MSTKSYRPFRFLPAQAGAALVFAFLLSTALASVADRKLGLTPLESERSIPHVTASAAPNRHMSPGTCIYFPDEVDHSSANFSPVNRLKPGHG